MNAAQAIAPGAPDKHRITVRTGTTASSGAFLEVVDDGRGMTAEELNRVFAPFFTSGAIGTSMGLGLTVCRNIVRAHKGEITVRSEPRAGTTVRVELPSGI